MIIDVIKSSGFSPQQKSEFADVQQCIDLVMKSEAFKAQILEARFNLPRSQMMLTNQEIYDLLVHDRLSISLRRYRTWKWWSRVVGYVLGKGSKTIHCNAKYWDSSPALDNASFLIHEYSHIKGFTHASASDSMSVPYVLNRIVMSVGRAIGLDVR